MGSERDAVPLPVGTTLGGKYQLTRVIGAGGMGAVYEAVNSWTNRRVAIKVLLAEHASRPEVVERFTQEARTATLIAHPNIVDVLDMGQDAGSGVLFIVQELLDGMDLSECLERRGPYSPAEALSIVTPVMGALVAAHRRGIVHRDLKPENIFLARNAEGMTVPKVIDFGISKLIDDAQSERRRTQTGTAIGTPQYMSPEQARGDRDVDGRSDVWSMGVVLYEMLSGKVPFEAPNYNLLIVQIITQAPTRIESVLPTVSRELAEVVHRALSPDREQRFASMQDFLNALVAVGSTGAVLAGAPDRPSHERPRAARSPRPGEADRLTAGETAVTVPNAANNATLTPPPWSEVNVRPRPERRSRTFTATLVVGVIVTGVAGGLAVGLGGGVSARPQRRVTVVLPTTPISTPPTAPAVAQPSLAVEPTPVSPAPAAVPVPESIIVPPRPVRAARTSPPPARRTQPTPVPPPTPRIAAQQRAIPVPQAVAAPSRPAPPSQPERTRRSTNNAPILEVD